MYTHTVFSSRLGGESEEMRVFTAETMRESLQLRPHNRTQHKWLRIGLKCARMTVIFLHNAFSLSVNARLASLCCVSTFGCVVNAAQGVLLCLSLVAIVSCAKTFMYQAGSSAGQTAPQTQLGNVQESPIIRVLRYQPGKSNQFEQIGSITRDGALSCDASFTQELLCHYVLIFEVRGK